MFPTLKESQIKSWWSTYHQKQKQIAKDLVEEARQLRSQYKGKSSKEIMSELQGCLQHGLMGGVRHWESVVSCSKLKPALLDQESRTSSILEYIFI